MSGIAMLNPCIKWHGSKHRLRSWVGRRLAPNDIYLEPFGGPASVLLNRPRAKTEIYNDLDKGMVALMVVIRDRLDELLDRLRLLRFGIETYRQHQELYRTEQTILNRAVSHFVLGRMGFGGGRWGGGFSYSPIVRKTWGSSLDRLYPIHERLQGVLILNRDGVELLEEYSRCDVTTYCDPPYHPSARSGVGHYTCEMTHEDHERLAQVLLKSRAKIAISAYPCAAYESWYRSWHQSRRAVTKQMSPARPQADEVLWTNYDVDDCLSPVRNATWCRVEALGA